MNDGFTFVRLEMEDMYNPVVNKVEKKTKKMIKQFKDYNIRGFKIETKKDNFYLYLKNLAFKKYRKKHLIRIIRKQKINIFSRNELNKIKRTKSHKMINHQKIYHILIYRNFINFKYNPYVMPLSKEDKSHKLFYNLTDINKKRKKIKKQIYINPYLEMKIKTLTKINERLKERERVKSLNKLTYTRKTKSNPSINTEKFYKFNKLLVNNWNNQRKRLEGKIPKLISEKTKFTSVSDINISSQENTKKYESFLFQSVDLKKHKKIILPKIGEECLKTINNLNQIKSKIKIYKVGNKERKNTDEDKINDDNLLNLNLPQLYKLFYIKNKKKNKLKTIKKQQNIKINQQDKTNNLADSKKESAHNPNKDENKEIENNKVLEVL